MFVFMNTIHVFYQSTMERLLKTPFCSVLLAGSLLDSSRQKGLRREKVEEDDEGLQTEKRKQLLLFSRVRALKKRGSGGADFLLPAKVGKGTHRRGCLSCLSPLPTNTLRIFERHKDRKCDPA